MVCTKKDQVAGGYSYATLDGMEIDLLQISILIWFKWNGKWIVQRQEYFYRKTATPNLSSVPKYECL